MWLVRACALAACVFAVLGAEEGAIPLPSSVNKENTMKQLPLGATNAKPSPKPSMYKLPKLGWKCQACMDTAAQTHKMHALLNDVLPQVLLRSRSGQTSADLGVRLGCMALPVEERTPCHSVRYSIASSTDKAFEAAAFAAARDSHMMTRLPSAENVQLDELHRYSQVLRSQDPDALKSVETQFVEAVAFKDGMREAVRKAANVFHSCSQLSMCDSEDTARGCEQALESDLCLTSGTCEPAVRSCKQRCRHCAWVLRSWPAWEGDCAKLTNPKARISTSSRAPRMPSTVGDTPTEGFLSPSFESSLRDSPRTENELLEFCWSLAWAMQDLPDAEMIVAGGAGSAGQQFMGPTPWSPVLSCACLGQCAYSSAESLVLHDAGCLGPSSAREVEAWRRRTEEEAEGGARMYRTQLASEREHALQQTWFDGPKDYLAARKDVRRVALEDRGKRTFYGGAIPKDEQLRKLQLLKDKKGFSI